MDKSRPVVISLGGSLVVPNGLINTRFLTEFNSFIREKIAHGFKFFICIGGGATARHYIEAAKQLVGSITDRDLDWLGIHATRLNAHLIRTMFHDLAHPRVISNYEKKIENLTQPLVIAAGGKPGWSTDYDSAMLARDYNADMLINMSNIETIYESDPRKNPQAAPLHHITWEQMEKLVGEKWKPGINVPFDPVATRLAKKLGLKVYVIGKNLKNLDNILMGKEFLGTVITSA